MKQSLTGIDFKNTSSILAGVQSKNQIAVPDGSRLSFEGEILIRSFGTWAAVMGNFSHASGGSNPDSYGFNVIFRPTTAVFSYGEKGVSAYKTATIDYSATLNTFFKFRAEYFNGKISLFINDELVGAVSVGTIAFLNSYFIVGRWSRIFNDYFFNGIVKTAKVSIDNVTVLFYDFTLPTATDLVKDRTVNKNDGSILGASPLVKSTVLYPKKNMFDYRFKTPSAPTSYTKSEASVIVTSDNGSFRILSSEVYKVKPNTQYTLSAFNEIISGSDIPRIAIRKGSDSSSLTLVEGTGSRSVTFNTGSETEIIFYFYSSLVNVEPQIKKYSNIQLEEGSVATPFEPYELVSKAAVKYPKRNLVKPFANWDTLASEMVVTSPYKAKMSTSQASKLSMINLNTKPNTVYTVKANHNGRLGVYKGGTIPVRAYGSEQTFTFNSGQYDQLSLYFNNAVPGDFFLEDVMVYEGTEDVPFKPYELTMKPAILYPTPSGMKSL